MSLIMFHFYNMGPLRLVGFLSLSLAFEATSNGFLQTGTMTDEGPQRRLKRPRRGIRSRKVF